MLNPYHDKIDIQRVLMLQSYQYQDALYLEQEVPANSQIDAQVLISSLGHFMLLSMTGSYTTKALVEGDPADTGVNYLYGQMIDGSSQRTLFENFIPLNLFLSPGREKILPLSGAASNPLFLEYPFVYTFAINSSLIMRLTNSSDYANIVKIMFKGVRIFDSNRQSL